MVVHLKLSTFTGKSLSEALIFALYCGLVDARISASEKYLPVPLIKNGL